MKDILRILLISLLSFTVISCGEKEESSSSSSSSGTTTLSAPSDFTATLGYYQVALDWTAVREPPAILFIGASLRASVLPALP